MSYLPTTPQSIGGVLDLGVRLYRASMLKVLPLAIAGALLPVLPYVVVPEALTNPLAAMDQLGRLAGAWAVVAPLTIALYAALILRLNDIATGAEQYGAWSAFAASWRHVLPVFFAALLYAVIIVVGMLLLVVPGIILMLSMGFFYFAVVLDRVGVFESLIESHRLVWGNWWRTAVILTIVVVMWAALYVAVGVVIGVAAVAGGGDESTFESVATIAQLVLQVVMGAILTPLMYGMSLVIYRELQLRKGGGDLAARIAKPAA